MSTTYSYKELVKELGIDGDTGPSKRRAPPTLTVVPSDAGSPAMVEGGRNAALTRIGGSLRRVGLEQNDLAAVLNAVNDTSCNPPLDGSEVDKIAASLVRYAPSDPGAVLSTLTDAGNADRFAANWGDKVRFVPEWRKWIVWVDNYWSPDEVNGVVELAKATAREINAEAAAISDVSAQATVAKHARQSQQLPRLNAMLELAKSIPAMVVRAAELDRDPMLLGVRNGTIDLRTGKLRTPRQDDFITKRAPVDFDPDAKCPEFDKFLNTVMAGDVKLVEYVRRILGYGLTGLTTEQCLFFFHGKGANGKSTLLNVIKEMLGGDYCKQTPSESLMVQYHGRSSTNDLARLQSVRVVLSNEVEEGSRLSESLIKQMTGGDPISARFLYAEFFDFVPKFKLIIAGNHQPVIRGDDTGIWRRLHLLPFSVTIPPKQRDKSLPGKLRDELPGILNFAIGGCRAWQKQGLNPPAAIEAALAEYRSEMDILGQWISDSCVVGDGLEIRASVAYAKYKEWAKFDGLLPMSNQAFGRRLKERHARVKDRHGWVYKGLQTKEQQFLSTVGVPGAPGV